MRKKKCEVIPSKPVQRECKQNVIRNSNNNNNNNNNHNNNEAYKQAKKLVKNNLLEACVYGNFSSRLSKKKKNIF